jgi:hypothetical protein
MKAAIAAAVVFGLMLLGAISAWTKDPNDQHASINYGANGNHTGRVSFETKDVARNDALAVGEFLSETGWFAGRPNPRPALRGKAMGSYGYGAAGRGYGEPEAEIVKSGSGLRVIVFTSAAAAKDDAVRDLAIDARSTLSQKLGKPTELVVRVERKQGKGLAWDDYTWN